MGTVLAVLGVLAVLFVTAVVATRPGEVLVDAPRDEPDDGLPADGPVRAADLDAVRLPMALRGYRMAEVDALLDRLVREIAERDDRLAALEGTAPPEGATGADAGAGADGAEERVSPPLPPA